MLCARVPELDQVSHGPHSSAQERRRDSDENNGTYHTVPPNPPSGLKPIALPETTPTSTALKYSGDFGKIGALVDCAGHELDHLNDALKAVQDRGRVVATSSRRAVQHRPSYMKSPVIKGLKSSMMKELNVKEMLTTSVGEVLQRDDRGPEKVGMVSMCNLGEVHKALEAATARSNDRTVILP